MRKFTKVAVAVAAAVSLTAASVEAQSGNINAKASVLQPITIAQGAELDFGSVLPGVNSTVAASSGATAGRFDMTGVNGANVNLSFVLPANLSFGANTLPIGTWTGCHNTSASQAGCTGFTPSAGATPTAFGASGLYVYIGATVSPAGVQPAGLYQGTVTLNAAYF
jgi:hypothetical protein